MDRLAGVLLIGIITAAWMNRWEIVPSSGAETFPSAGHFKLNRFTGSSYYCHPQTSCVKIDMKND